jgi:rubredoxin
MEKKNYIQDLNDNNILKRILEDYACIDCGLIQNDNDRIMDEKWEKIDDKMICPECNRKRKLKKIKRIINEK